MDLVYSQLIVVATLLMMGALFTVATFDTWQTVLMIILFIIKL